MSNISLGSAIPSSPSQTNIPADAAGTDSPGQSANMVEAGARSLAAYSSRPARLEIAHLGQWHVS